MASAMGKYSRSCFQYSSPEFLCLASYYVNYNFDRGLESMSFFFLFSAVTTFPIVIHGQLPHISSPNLVVVLLWGRRQPSSCQLIICLPLHRILVRSNSTLKVRLFSLLSYESSWFWSPSPPVRPFPHPPTWLTRNFRLFGGWFSPHEDGLRAPPWWCAVTFENDIWR